MLKHKVSVFKSCVHTNSNKYMEEMSIYDVLVMGMKYKIPIEELRKYSGKETEEIEKIYKNYKKQFPVWTPSCLCNNGSKDIVEIYNIICIDIDLQDNPDMDPEKVKEELIKLPSIFYTSLSIGGKGVFGLMGLSGNDSFKERFDSVRNYILKETGYVIDKSCCNPNRLRIISYDENPIFKSFESELVPYNGKVSKVLETKESIYKPLYSFSLPKRNIKRNDYTDLLNDDKFCIICSDYCINKLMIQTTDYSNWLSHLGSLSTLGYEGQELGIQLSRQSPKYQSDEDVIRTMNTLLNKGNQRQYLTRYFRMCKENLGKNWIQELKKLYNVQ